MKYSHIIWDFNGTIVNDIEATMHAENFVFANRNMPIFKDVEHLRDEFMLPFKDFYKKMGIDFSNESYEDLSDEFMQAYLRFSKDCTVHDGAIEAFERFKALSIPQVIISASEITVLLSQVKQFGIDNYFDEILGLSDYLAISKVHLAKDWMDRIKPTAPLFIGDTVHDFEVAQAVGIDCVLVATGSQRASALSQYTKTYENLKECIADIINL